MPKNHDNGIIDWQVVTKWKMEWTYHRVTETIKNVFMKLRKKT
jgi:hypothetical protein